MLLRARDRVTKEKKNVNLAELSRSSWTVKIKQKAAVPEDWKGRGGGTYMHYLFQCQG